MRLHLTLIGSSPSVAASRRRRRASCRSVLPFGSGARSCVGQSLALLEARTFLRELLKVYELKPVPGFAPSIKAGVSLTSAGGVRVRLVRRAV